MWFLQRLRCKVNMESSEAKSQLDNQQKHPDSQFHSDPSIDNDNLVQVLAQDIENLVLSCKDEAIDRCIQGKSGLNQVNEAVDKDPNECRVLEDREAGESEIRCENQVKEAVGVDGEVCELKDEDLKEKHEVEMEDGSEVGGWEDNGEHVEDLSENVGGDGWEDNGELVEDLSENVGGDGWDEGSVSVTDDGKSKSYHYPLRLDGEDCSFYMRKGMCKYGSNCKFNHPTRRKTQQPTKEAKKQKEENVERRGRTECKYHASSAGCKHGKACKFNHGRGKTVKTPVLEYNFLGLPIRPGEKECPYYMRNGSCKYGPSCRFNHPDPTAVGGDDAPTSYGNERPLPLQPAPQPNIPNMPSWSAPRTPDPTAPFVPMMYPPAQNMPPPSSGWNGYQAPAPVPAHSYPSSEQGLPIPPAFFLNNPPSDTNMYTHHQQPMLVSEYPERPGQPDCSYFMKTGDCKFRASCKFNHPQSRSTGTLKDQNICTYFSKHGTCKYGSACKYDHPVNYNSNSNHAGEGY